MDEIRQARFVLKGELLRTWPYRRCACGEEGATDLGHIVYTRHPDSVDLYHPFNMALLHNACNTTGEALWINVNACLILLQRAGSIEEWEKWAKGLPRKGGYYIPEKMRMAMDIWRDGVRPYDFVAIMDYVNRPMGGADG